MATTKKDDGTTAKLFLNGGSQAVRLPKEFRFPGQSQVRVRRDGRRVILEPLDEWSEDFLRCLGSWEGTIERPEQGRLDEVEDPFAE